MSLSYYPIWGRIQKSIFTPKGHRTDNVPKRFNASSVPTTVTSLADVAKSLIVRLDSAVKKMYVSGATV